MKHDKHQQHDINPESVLAALQGRVGAANGVTATKLVIEIADRVSEADERRLRDCVTYLRHQGHPVCATPGDGYFIAANDQELNDTCQLLYGRAMTSIKQVAAMKKKALPELAGQLGLPVNQDEESNDERP